MAEVYFENRAALVEALDTAEGQAAAAMLLEDEAKFIDLPNSPLWVGYEYPQINPTPENLVARTRSNLAKLYFPLRCPEERDPADAQLYWRTHHGPIIRRHAQASGIQRYLQVHRALDDELNGLLTAPRGTVVEPYLGHAEVWFDHSNAASTPERTEANRAGDRGRVHLHRLQAFGHVVGQGARSRRPPLKRLPECQSSLLIPRTRAAA